MGTLLALTLSGLFFSQRLGIMGPPNTYQKNPRVRKIRVRNSGAGNGCPNFMDTWKKCVLSAGKPMSIKFLVLGGGGILGFWGGGECRFYFYGREDFSELKSKGTRQNDKSTLFYPL